MDNELAKALLVHSDKIYYKNGELCLLSQVMYSDKGEVVMYDICPLCNTKHYTPFQYVEGIAQIKCPNTGVKIYAIYA